MSASSSSQDELQPSLPCCLEFCLLEHLAPAVDLQQMVLIVHLVQAVGAVGSVEGSVLKMVYVVLHSAASNSLG